MNQIQVLILFICIPIYFKGSFKISSLDLDNKKERNEVCNLFSFQDIQENTTIDTAEMSLVIDENKKGIFIAKTLDEEIVAGVLVASYVPNAINGWGRTIPWNNIQNYSVGKQDALHLDVVAIHPDYRNFGIATSLIENAKHCALDLKIPYIILSVLKDNISAISCYKKLGFEFLREGFQAVALCKKIKEDLF